MALSAAAAALMMETTALLGAVHEALQFARLIFSCNYHARRRQCAKGDALCALMRRSHSTHQELLSRVGRSIPICSATTLQVDMEGNRLR